MGRELRIKGGVQPSISNSWGCMTVGHLASFIYADSRQFLMGIISIVLFYHSFFVQWMMSLGIANVWLGQVKRLDLTLTAIMLQGLFKPTYHSCCYIYYQLVLNSILVNDFQTNNCTCSWVCHIFICIQTTSWGLYNGWWDAGWGLPLNSILTDTSWNLTHAKLAFELTRSRAS